MKDTNVYISSVGDAQSHVHLETGVLAQSELSLWGLEGVAGPEDCGPEGQIEGFLVTEALGVILCEVHRPAMPMVRLVLFCPQGTWRPILGKRLEKGVAPSIRFEPGRVVCGLQGADCGPATSQGLAFLGHGLGTGALLTA